MRRDFINEMNVAIEKGEHLIGAVSGSGLTAKYVIKGGADFILALNSGIFRGMGRGSLGGLLPYANANDMVEAFGKRELIPMTKKFPVFFGLNATDPTRDIGAYLSDIKSWGFMGIVNYPTVGLFDGAFQEALERGGNSYNLEVEAIHQAHKMGLATIAFAFDTHQAEKMVWAGADILCVHLGLTQGGLLGAQKALSLVAGKDRVNRIFEVCDRLRPGIIKMIYGGPVKTPVDVQYMYQNTATHGYIGGSAFDRIPTEKSLLNITKAFKSSDSLDEDSLMTKMLEGVTKYYDYSGFVKEYVKENYMNEISFLDLAEICHVSRSHLSATFKKDVGCSFPEYLVNYRMHKAAKFFQKENLLVSEVAELVGYQDVPHFSKMFKKYMGVSPKTYKQS